MFTDRNFGVQLKKLEASGYISAAKRLVRRWHVTDYALIACYGAGKFSR